MKYRRLTLDELQTLEQQFIQFLSVNTVTASDWEKIKGTNPTRANALIEEFSDVVLSSVLEKAQFLVHAQQKEVIGFKCDADQMTMVGVTTDVEANFHLQKSLSEAIQALPENAKINTFFLEKKYANLREQDIFQLLEQGAQVADAYIFNQIFSLHQQSI